MRLSEANAVNALLSVLAGQVPYALFPRIPLTPGQVEQAVQVLAGAARKTLDAGWKEDAAAQVIVSRLDEQGYFDLPEDRTPEQVSPTPTGSRQQRVTLYVTISNSDGKLKQMQWSRLVADVKTFVDTWATFVDTWAWARHGAWFSAPDVGWQNACWCFESHLDAGQLDLLREDLRAIAWRWGQDSIALAVVPEVEMVTPRERPSDEPPSEGLRLVTDSTNERPER